VLQVLPGGAEAGEAICTDPDIAMVSFTDRAASGGASASLRAST
jgi:benzaldehyde dehydrogenase (NAD)